MSENVKISESDNGRDPLSAALLLLYELTIANAPYSPADCRDLADKIGARIGEARALLQRWKSRAAAFHEGYKDKAFEVTSLEIQLMDLRAHGADKVTARINENLRAKLLAACIERNERKQIAEAARDFIWEPENWEAYQDSKESNSAAWPPEFLLLAQAVEDAYGPMPVDDPDNADAAATQTDSKEGRMRPLAAPHDARDS